MLGHHSKCSSAKAKGQGSSAPRHRSASG
eukprot:COSAG01_NODE_43940_length_424_cov_1.396923_1_plen_28_part_10